MKCEESFSLNVKNPAWAVAPGVAVSFVRVHVCLLAVSRVALFIFAGVERPLKVCFLYCSCVCFPEIFCIMTLLYCMIIIISCFSFSWQNVKSMSWCIVRITKETFIMHLLLLPYKAGEYFGIIFFDLVKAIKSNQACYVTALFSP